SEVKRISADGSVGLPHVRVGHRQALNLKKPTRESGLFLHLEQSKSDHQSPSYKVAPLSNPCISFL
ncbi:hypothetical protein ACPV5H_23395, partial [Vibrio harveyi]|uniref:hypothetical protein n=2 Tax=Vibrio harveyi TaxID=669 RepID=UPI004069765A